MKNKILFFQFSYLPGNKAGGSLRTLANMADHLGEEFDMRIVCLDRDSGEKQPYPNIKIHEWQRVGKADVMYLSPQKLSYKVFQNIILATKPDLIYLNSFFHPIFTRKPLFLRRLGLISKLSFVIAPRGEFSSGAIMLKSFRKYAYIYLARTLGLVNGIIWHASNKQEAAEIRHLFGDHIRVMIAPDIPSQSLNREEQKCYRKKEKGNLKLIFLSRIARKKNLSGALELLRGLTGEVQFNIYGPIEDNNYWQECQKIIWSLPQNVDVHYCGEVEYSDVVKIMQEHDLFFMPTLGENYGYVYLEALVAGCPILLSDQTPWVGLERAGVGWDIPISQSNRFREILQNCIAMDNNAYREYSVKARKYGLNLISNKEALRKNRELFLSVLNAK